MSEIIRPIYCNLKWNLTVCEAIFLLFAAFIIYKYRKERIWLFTAYYDFVILYITLLHRQPVYERTLKLEIDLLPSDGGWAGNLLNLLLYIPLGLAACRWNADGTKIVFCSFLMSVFCETIQFILNRGMADINDVLFNTLGSAIGAYLVKWLTKRK